MKLFQDIEDIANRQQLDLHQKFNPQMAIVDSYLNFEPSIYLFLD